MSDLISLRDGDAWQDVVQSLIIKHKTSLKESGYLDYSIPMFIRSQLNYVVLVLHNGTTQPPE